MAILRDIGILAAGLGFSILCLAGAYVLLNLNRSLDRVHGMLEDSQRELGQTLPAVRDTVQQVNLIVRQVSHRVQAADHLVTTTGAAVSSWRQRAWDVLRAPAFSVWSAVQGMRRNARGAADGEQHDPRRWGEEEHQ